MGKKSMCQAVRYGEVKRKGKPSIEYYDKEGKPVYYCYGYRGFRQNAKEKRTMTEKLKSCPFCGGTRIIIDLKRFGYDYCIYCYDCGGRTKNFSSAKLAAEAWNRRVDDAERSGE